MTVSRRRDRAAVPSRVREGGDTLGHPEDHALLRKFEDIGAATGKPPAYYFRIFPHREMISDMIRFSGHW